MLKLGLALASGCLIACGDGGTSAPGDTGDTGDTGAFDPDATAEVVDAGDIAGIPVEDMNAAQLCAHIWTRLTNCGHFYTYPRFPEKCAAWDATQIETLRACARKPCGDLVTCVEPLYGTPGQ